MCGAYLHYNPPMRLGLDVRLTYYTRGGIARYIRRLAADLPTLDPAHHYVHLYRRGHAETFSPLARRVECWTPAHHRLEIYTLALEALLTGSTCYTHPTSSHPWGAIAAPSSPCTILRFCTTQNF